MLTKWRNWGVCTVDHYVCIHACHIIIIIIIILLQLPLQPLSLSKLD